MMRSEFGDRFESGHGDPVFRRAAVMPPAPDSHRRTLAYATTVFKWPAQNHPPLLPDPVYADAQAQVVEALAPLALDLRLKPHPESRVKGEAHPLAGMVPFDERPFGEVLAEAHVLIFDYFQTTAFWEATMTDRPIVLIDHGISRLTDEARAMVEARCRIVASAFDGRGRTVIDPDELREAVETLPEKADGAPFRRLFAGVEA